MTNILDIKQQGLRVHKLANLRGLVAIAGLENNDPTTLLGALMEMARQLPQISQQELEYLNDQGLQKLRERNSEKRIYKQKQETRDLSKEITFSAAEIKKLIIKLGGKIPVFDRDLIPELRRLME
jgi:hypothetical protein